MFKQLDTLGKILYTGTIVPIFLSLCTPLLIQSSFLFPFITPKTLFFRILIEIALFFYVLLALRYRHFRPYLNKLSLIVVVFFVIATIASIFGVDTYRSFWGNIERGEGLLTLYHVGIFFIIGTQVLKTRKQWEWLLHALVWVTVITGIYGLLQFFGSENVINTSGSRLSSTIGNASFFAGYLLFGIFIAGWFSATRRNVLIRSIYALVVLFEFFILIKTETRGAFIGLIFGIIISGACAFFISKNKKIKTVLAGSFILFILIASALWLNRDAKLIQNMGLLRRLTTISYHDITTQSRLLTWDTSWNALKDRPLFGYGWENYNIGFNAYFHPEIYIDQGSQIWFDRAHNIFFDISVSTGTLGLLAYLTLLLYALNVLYRYYKKTHDYVTTLFFSSLLIAYTTANMFVFDVLATYINFYSVLGFIVFLEKQIALTKEDAFKDKKIGIARAPWFPSLSLVLFFVTVIIIFRFNILPAQANRLALDALIYSAQGNFPQAAETFRKALKRPTNQRTEIRQKYAEFALKLPQTQQHELAARELSNAIAEIKKSITEHPYDTQHYLFLMILYNQSDQYDARRLERVLETGEKALVLSPTRPHIYYELGQAYIALGNTPEALKAFSKALELQPHVIESQWNLAAAYIFAGEHQKAQEIFDKLIADGYPFNSVNNLQRIALLYQQSGQWQRAIDVYTQLTSLDPENFEWYTYLARMYERIGDYNRAQNAALQAKELNQTIARDVDLFLEQINERATTSSEPEF